jgi:hypothetical protein
MDKDKKAHLFGCASLKFNWQRVLDLAFAGKPD